MIHKTGKNLIYKLDYLLWGLKFIKTDKKELMLMAKVTQNFIPSLIMHCNDDDELREEKIDKLLEEINEQRENRLSKD